MDSNRDSYWFARLSLRVSIAFAFLYPPISALRDPYSWIGYFPRAFSALPVSSTVLLHAFGALEVVLALWILSGRRIRIPSLVAAFLLLAIVVANYADFEVLFRDVALAFAAVALAFMPVFTPRTDQEA